MPTIITQNINLCAEFLLNSQVVAFPTETVYGLGAIATDPVAVSKVYEIKNRPNDNPLICHFYNFKQIQKYAINIPKYVKYLVENFSPGPLSYVLTIPDNSPLKVQGRILERIFRIPNQAQTLELIKKINLPLAGPSSNLSGRPSHTNPTMVLTELENKIPAILDGGESQIGLESTILECKLETECKILRPGAIGQVELEKVFKKYALQVKVLPYTQEIIKNIPGNKYPHYSPKTPILKISPTDLDTHTAPTHKKILVLGQKSTLDSLQNKNIQSIIIGQDLEEYAHNLYYELQKLDTLKLDFAYLLIEDFGESSLAKALNNRISKIGTYYNKLLSKKIL
jgi:L-threonylcarbamoyladenylate synthase